MFWVLRSRLWLAGAEQSEQASAPPRPPTRSSRNSSIGCKIFLGMNKKDCLMFLREEMEEDCGTGPDLCPDLTRTEHLDSEGTRPGLVSEGT